MKKNLIVIIAIVLASYSSFAAENDVSTFLNLNDKQELNLTLPKDDQAAAKAKVIEKYDSAGVFYDVEIDSLLFFPKDITIGVGVSSPSKRMEAELYAGLNAIRLLSVGSVHIPYGARVRVALNENRTIYVEYTYQDVVDFGDKSGLFENPHTLSIIKMDQKSKSYYGCGIGTTIHHAWNDEDYHAPEKSLALTCKAGKRF